MKIEFLHSIHILIYRDKPTLIFYINSFYWLGYKSRSLSFTFEYFPSGMFDFCAILMPYKHHRVAARNPVDKFRILIHYLHDSDTFSIVSGKLMREIYEETLGLKLNMD